MIRKNISVAALTAPELEVYSIEYGGKIIHVYNANIIRLLSQIFGVPCKIFLSSELGTKLPDANWTGIIGMVNRSEVDLAVGGSSITDSRFQAVSFSYPYQISGATFMTDKPKPQPTNLAFIYPFPLMLWILLLAATFLFSSVLYLYVYRKETYQNILFMIFGSLLEKSIGLHLRKLSIRLIISAWFMFTFVITNSYKAVLLSILTIPSFTGIRDIRDLAKAAERNSVACYSYKGAAFEKLFLESEIDTWRSIGKCLQRNAIFPVNTEQTFEKLPSKKAFITARSYMKPYKEKYFISDDSFFNTMHGIPVSRHFCCHSYLNKRIQWVFETGVFQKIEKDEEFFLGLDSAHLDSSEPGRQKILQLEDLKGAFIILFAGYALSTLVLFIEIAVKYYYYK